jgi:phage terminase small subunit
MSRKSAASLAVVPPVTALREQPPANLAPDEAAEWRKVVESLPPHWFPGASFTLLELYCQVVTNAR